LTTPRAGTKQTARTASPSETVESQIDRRKQIRRILGILSQISEAKRQELEFPLPPNRQFHFDDAAQAKLKSILKSSDHQAVNLFLKTAETVIAWRQCFNAKANGFPASRLQNIQRALNKAATLLDKARPQVRSYVDRAFVQYTEGAVDPRVAMGWLRGYARALDAYIRLRQPARSPKGGRPAKAEVHATIAELAKLYEQILHGRPSAGSDSRFRKIVLLLLPSLGEKINDPRRLIQAALRK
jgi:hypothetical protein